MRPPWGFVLAYLVIAGPAYPQTPGANGAPAVRPLAESEFEAIRLQKVLTAVRIDERITLDGRFDEPAWQRAIPGADFYQRIPLTGAPATDRTEVRVLYDDDNLYVGIICFDP